MCEYGDPDCTPDEDYELMCDEHRGDHSASIADMWNDFD